MSDQLSQDLASLRIQRDEDPDRKNPVVTGAIVLAVLATLAGGAVLAYPVVEAQIFKSEVTSTQIATISPVQSSITLTSTGYVVAQTTSKVGAKVPGRVARVLVKEGDVVKTGDLIAELDSVGAQRLVATASARVAAARARASASRASAAQVRQQVERQRPLVASGATAKATLDDLEAQLKALEEAAKASEAEIGATAAEVNALRSDLDDRKIYAPIDGTVITKPIEVGQVVGMQFVESIAEIADFKTLVVETDVPESRLHMVKAGSPCEIVLDAYPTRRYRGKAIEIGKRVNRAKATVTVKVAFVDPAENALPDMSARTSFLAQELDAEAMKEPPKRVVPASALATRGGGQVVFTIDQGKLKMVPVKVGAAMGSSFELLEGPSEGTRVVANPSDELGDGQKIKEKDEG